MRKGIVVLLVLVAAVLICGCTGNHGKEIVDGGNESVVPDQETPNTTPAVVSVSQEDLDRLKNDLAALDFDEPGGFSGD
jgi:uncharacterized lipoprotein YajG